MKIATYLTFIKRIAFVFVLTLLTQFTVFSQCLPDGITFSTQAQIDSFQTDYPGCTEILGDVNIDGDDINDLTGLNIITKIYGNLLFGDWSPNNNPLLVNLNGLENLTYIGGNLDITHNNSLLTFIGISNLDSIAGNLIISANYSIHNLYGLGSINLIGKNLRITNNSQLTTFFGIGNLNSIGGSLNIHSNNDLTDISSLSNITFVPGNIDIFSNDQLDNLIGLGNISSIGGDLRIEDLESLENFMDLSSLNSIGESLIIDYNYGLLNLNGLESLNTINGKISIFSNTMLNSLSGLENLSPESISQLEIYHNTELSNCNAQSICNYLASPNGSIDIYYNGTGCNNPNEIANNCGFTISCLPYGNYHFNTQDDIDNFQSIYPDCNDINGSILIKSNVENLNGLLGITSVQNYLSIKGVYYLEDLQGLNNVQNVGTLFIWWNESLESLEGLNSLDTCFSRVDIFNNENLLNLNGLENLKFIGSHFSLTGCNFLQNIDGLTSLNTVNGFFVLGQGVFTNTNGLNNLAYVGNGFDIHDCDSLTDISALSNLSLIGGSLNISNNYSLASLSGLDNVEPDSVDWIAIRNNSSLSQCAIQSVCNFLADSNAIVGIENNAPGCNSEEEVEQACLVFVDETSIQNQIIIYPNPTQNKLYFSGSENKVITQITIYNQMGQKVLQTKSTDNAIDISGLEKGLFVVEVEIDGVRFRKKLIKN